MGQDYDARKLAKKRRKANVVEDPEGKRQKRRNKTRRICRGMCFQDPAAAATDEMPELAPRGDARTVQRLADQLEREAGEGGGGRKRNRQPGRQQGKSDGGGKSGGGGGGGGGGPPPSSSLYRLSTSVGAPGGGRSSGSKQAAGGGVDLDAGDAAADGTGGVSALPPSKRRKAQQQEGGAGGQVAESLRRWPDLVQRFFTGEGMEAPTAVQEQSWPATLGGRDVQAVSAPGSGKTLAYLLPGAVRVAAALAAATAGAADAPGEVCSPIVLVLVPTRELAQQVTGVARSLRPYCGLRAAALHGGADREAQMQGHPRAATQGGGGGSGAGGGTGAAQGGGGGARGAHLVVATPGRLIELLQARQVSLARLEAVVLDEADKMLGQGLAQQLTQLRGWLLPQNKEEKKKKKKSRTRDAGGAKEGEGEEEGGGVDVPGPACRPQVLLFTATMPESLEGEASNWLRSRTLQRVKVADEHTAASISSSVTQVVQVCAEHKKPSKLVKHLEAVRLASAGQRNQPRVLVFANRVKTVRFLADLLAGEEGGGHRPVQLHGERSQAEREEALRDFRSGKATLMVATDVAARGLHIRNLPYIVMYDFPSNLETYIHRCGRTGRLSTSGHCFSFLTRNLAPLARPLLELLAAHNQAVDPNLIRLADAYDKAAQALALEGPKEEGGPDGGAVRKVSVDEVSAHLGLETSRTKKQRKAKDRQQQQQVTGRDGAGSGAGSGTLPGGHGRPGEEEEEGEEEEGVGAALVQDVYGSDPDVEQAALPRRRTSILERTRRSSSAAGAAAAGGRPAAAKRGEKKAGLARATTTTATTSSGGGGSGEAAGGGGFFQTSARFTGARPGCCFKKGPQGVGYYVDLPPAAAGAGAGARLPPGMPVPPAGLVLQAGAAANGKGKGGGRHKALPGRLRKKLASQRQAS